MTLVDRPTPAASPVVTDPRTPAPAERSYQLPIVHEIAVTLAAVERDDCW